MAPAMCSTDSKLLLLDRYDVTFGICNHDLADFDRPLLLVGMHAAENSSLGSTIYERIDQFLNLAVAKHTGCSLTEFLELPSDVVMHILESCATLQKREESTATEMLAKLEDK